MWRRKHHLDDQVFLSGNNIVSLTICTAERKTTFHDPVIRGQVATIIAEMNRHDRRFLCFCVMPDHVHLLVLFRRSSPGKLVQALKAITTRRLKPRGIEKPVWQAGYYDHIIRREDGLLRSLRYLLLNPVRKGLVNTWEEWSGSGSCVWPNLNDGMLADQDLENVAWRWALEEEPGKDDKP